MVTDGDILVTATSFMRSEPLRLALKARLPNASLHFLDLRNPEELRQFHDINFTRSIIGWLAGGEPVTNLELERLPSLRLVSKYGVGVDNIDFAACSALGVKVYVEYGVNSLPVAEHTLGLILSLCRNIGKNSRLLTEGVWNKDGGRSLQGMKVGLIGLGHVGSKVAALLALLGADLGYCDPLVRPELERSLGIQRFTYEELLSRSDLLSFHVPLTDETRKMFGENAMTRTRPGVILINTSRGEVIDSKILKSGLKSGLIGGAGLDVFEKEPLRDKELAESPNLIATPHTAGNSLQAIDAMGQAAIRGLELLFKSDATC